MSTWATLCSIVFPISPLMVLWSLQIPIWGHLGLFADNFKRFDGYNGPRSNNLMLLNSHIWSLKAYLAPQYAHFGPLDACMEYLVAYLGPFDTHLRPLNAPLKPLDAHLRPLDASLRPQEALLRPWMVIFGLWMVTYGL